MLQVLVVCDSFHFIFNYLHHIRLDLGVVAVNLLLHDVVAILVLELVDDGYLLVSLCFRRYLFTIDNNPCVEIFWSISSPKLSATLPTNVPCERLAILDAGISESNCVLMEVDVSCRLIEMDCRCWSILPKRSDRLLPFPRPPALRIYFPPYFGLPSPLCHRSHG